MGGVGLANPSIYSTGLQNPALLPYTKFTQFDVGVTGELKKLESSSGSQGYNSAGLQHFSLNFPISKKLTSQVSLSPYSVVNFSTAEQSRVDGTATFSEAIYSGSGGISQMAFSNGFQIFKNGFVGFTVKRFFGSIERESQAKLQGSTGRYILSLFERDNYSGFGFDAGLFFKKKVKDNFNVNFGLVFTPEAKLKVKAFKAQKRLNVFSSEALSEDTTLVDNKSYVMLPSKLALATSFEINNKLFFELDYINEGWANSKDDETADLYRNTSSYRFGVEYIPDYTSASSYWKRVAYRGGVSYDEFPGKTLNKFVDDFSVSAGIGFPVAKGLSSINLAFRYGFVNPNDSKLMKETYLTCSLGVSINSSWFLKRKIN